LKKSAQEENDEAKHGKDSYSAPYRDFPYVLRCLGLDRRKRHSLYRSRIGSSLSELRKPD
jgi:hypothetical protein